MSPSRKAAIRTLPRAGLRSKLDLQLPWTFVVWRSGNLAVAALLRGDTKHREKAMGSTFTWAAAAAAVAATLAVAGVAAIFWNRLGASQISVAGWLAMVFGVIITLALGIGLMALMFISSRRGYDEGGRRDC